MCVCVTRGECMCVYGDSRLVTYCHSSGRNPAWHDAQCYDSPPSCSGHTHNMAEGPPSLHLIGSDMKTQNSSDSLVQ